MLYNDSWRTGMLTCNVEHLLTGSDRDVLIVPHLQRTVWTFWTCSGADEVQAPVEIFVASPGEALYQWNHCASWTCIYCNCSQFRMNPNSRHFDLKTQCQVEQKPKLRAEAKQLCQILSSLNQHWDSLACFVLLCFALSHFAILCHWSPGVRYPCKDFSSFSKATQAVAEAGRSCFVLPCSTSD